MTAVNTPPAVRMMRAQQDLRIAAQDVARAASQSVRDGNRDAVVTAAGRLSDVVAELFEATTAMIAVRGVPIGPVPPRSWRVGTVPPLSWRVACVPQGELPATNVCAAGNPAGEEPAPDWTGWHSLGWVTDDDGNKLLQVFAAPLPPEEADR